jgi:hypothetical protein
VDQLQRVFILKGQPPGQELVEDDAEAVEVRPPIHRPVHAPGLLGGDVGQRALDAGGGLGGVEPSADVEVDEAKLQRQGVHDDVRRLDVPVDDPLGVDGLQRGGQIPRDPQRVVQGEVLGGVEQVLEGGGAGVFEHQHQPVAVGQQIEGPHHMGAVDAGQQPVLPADLGHVPRRRQRGPGGLENDGRAVGSFSAVDDRSRTFVDAIDQLQASDSLHGVSPGPVVGNAVVFSNYKKPTVDLREGPEIRAAAVDRRAWSPAHRFPPPLFPLQKIRPPTMRESAKREGRSHDNGTPGRKPGPQSH